MGAPSLTNAAPETPWYRLFLRTPLTMLAIFVTVSLIAKENYPFSHFPMFASPTAERSYYMISDAEGRPLPITTLTGVTLPKIAKIHWRKSQERESMARKSGEQDSAGQEEAIGREICGMLRQQAIRRGKTLPQRMQLYRVEVQYDDGKIKETKRLLFAE